MDGRGGPGRSNVHGGSHGGESMRRYLVTAGSFVVLLGAATNASAREPGDHSDGGRDPVVVADGLDNPRQLSWSGDTLLVAEAGHGGDQCTTAPAAAGAGTAATGAGTSTTSASTGSTAAAATTGASDDGTVDQGPGDA